MGVNLLPWPTQCKAVALESAATSGYIIYRTTYTLQATNAFSRFTDILISIIKDQFFSKRESAPKNKPESIPYLGIWPENCQVILTDPMEFDEASIDSIHGHFESWTASHEKHDCSTIQWRCIIWDETSRQVFLSVPSPGTGEDIEPRAKGVPTNYRVNDMTSIAAHKNDNYDAFMGGERSDGESIGLEPYKKGMIALSGSEDDEHDSFLGGSI